MLYVPRISAARCCRMPWMMWSDLLWIDSDPEPTDQTDSVPEFEITLVIDAMMMLMSYAAHPALSWRFPDQILKELRLVTEEVVEVVMNLRY